jgi:hypothetical protein
MFYVGQMVVCTANFVGTRYVKYHTRLPAKGDVLVIRDVRPCPVDGKLGLVFEEIVSAIRTDLVPQVEQGFDAEYFKPVKKTDISVFTGALKEDKVGV